MNGNKYIESLIARFFEGETSNAEERELYDFFTGEDIPEELMRYKPLFGYFDTGLEEELKTGQEPVQVVKFRRNRGWLLAAGVAAVLLVGVLVRPLFHASVDGDLERYEGSYVIRNGVKITDLDEIRPEIEAAVRWVAQQEEEQAGWSREIFEPQDYATSAEEEMRKQYDELLDGIPEGPAREAARVALGIDN